MRNEANKTNKVLEASCPKNVLNCAKTKPKLKTEKTFTQNVERLFHHFFSAPKRKNKSKRLKESAQDSTSIETRRSAPKTEKKLQTLSSKHLQKVQLRRF